MPGIYTRPTTNAEGLLGFKGTSAQLYFVRRRRPETYDMETAERCLFRAALRLNLLWRLMEKTTTKFTCCTPDNPDSTTAAAIAQSDD